MITLRASTYDYDTNAAGDASGLKCKDKSLAQQNYLNDTDINTIVERFGITGELPTNVRMPQFADFQGIFDFQTAMNSIRHAQESFAAMPANVRARFHNDPAEFLDFVDDPANKPEAIKLGLVEAPLPAPSPEPLIRDPGVNPPTPKGG